MQRRKAVIVGAGGMGRSWGRNLAAIPEQVEIAGWVDIRPDAAASAADELGLALGYTGDDLGRALADLRPDFVVDVTVPESHHDVTLQALAAGVPVLGEKPMADSLEHARAMVAASECAGKLYMVSQSRRYNDKVRALRSLAREQLGTLGIINSDFYIGAHFGGFRDDMRSPLILDMAIHTFDAARYLCGRDPVAVYCEEFSPSWSWYKGDASATAIFEMENGLRYTHRGSWCAEGLGTSWESEWRMVGERGTAIWTGREDGCPTAEIINAAAAAFIRSGETITASVETQPSGIAGSVQDFLRALDTGGAPMGECHDNIKSLAMVFAAMESSDKRQRVPVRW